MLRSGSTLVEQILGRHSQVHAAGEIGLASASARQHLGPAPGAITAARMGAFRDASRAGLSRLRASAPVITDKRPHNCRWTGLLLRAFPEARIVHMVRDPRATCWSIFSHCFPTPEGGYDNDLRDLTEFHGLYADLMAFWHRLFRSEEHTSELQSHLNLVCRLLLEKKKVTGRNDKQPNYRCLYF